MKRFLLFFLPCLAWAQIQTIPNTTFPSVRTLLNSNFTYVGDHIVTPGTCPGGQYATAVTLSGVTCATVASSMTWPAAAGIALYGGSSAWGSSIAQGSSSQFLRGDFTLQTLNTTAVAEGSNLYFTNARAQSALSGMYEVPLTFGGMLLRSTNSVDLKPCTGNDGYIPKWRNSGGWGCEADQAGALDPSNVITGATFTFGSGSYTGGIYHNQNATAGTGVTGTLPVAGANKQFCLANSYNGSAANTGTLTIQTSASGQYIIYSDGTLSASGGYVITAGAAGDLLCVAGVDSTHWRLMSCGPNNNCAKH